MRVKYLSLSPCVCVGCGAKTINTAHPGASPWMALGIPPGRTPTLSSFLPPWWPLCSFLQEGGPQGPGGGYKGPRGGCPGTRLPAPGRDHRTPQAGKTPPPHRAWAHEVRGGPSLRWDGLSSSLQEPWTLQPEAMLLWLTLTLLWSPTCWAGGKSGWGSPVQSIPLETTLTSHHPGPGVWASSCHKHCSQTCPLVWRG